MALIYITDGDVVTASASQDIDVVLVEFKQKEGKRVREVKLLSCAAENLDDELERVLR